MNKLEMVKQWRRTFGLPVSETPVALSLEQLELHAKLISDEADEILDVVSVAGLIDGYKLRDVAVDLLYFALGLMCEAGIDFKESLTRYQAESQQIEGTHKIADVKDYIQSRCESFLEEVEFGKRETWTISEFAHDIATDAMLLVFLHELEDYLDADFAAVHAANMAKLWTTAQIDEKFDPMKTKLEVGFAETMPTDEGTWVMNRAGFNQWVVRLNGKVQKPPGWKAAVLEGGAV